MGAERGCRAFLSAAAWTSSPLLNLAFPASKSGLSTHTGSRFPGSPAEVFHPFHSLEMQGGKPPKGSTTEPWKVHLGDGLGPAAIGSTGFTCHWRGWGSKPWPPSQAWPPKGRRGHGHLPSQQEETSQPRHLTRQSQTGLPLADVERPGRIAPIPTVAPNPPLLGLGGLWKRGQHDHCSPGDSSKWSQRSPGLLWSQPE